MLNSFEKVLKQMEIALLISLSFSFFFFEFFFSLKKSGNSLNNIDDYYKTHNIGMIQIFRDVEIFNSKLSKRYSLL